MLLADLKDKEKFNVDSVLRGATSAAASRGRFCDCPQGHTGLRCTEVSPMFFHQISVRQFVVPGINIARTLLFQWCEAHEMVMDQKIVYD